MSPKEWPDVWSSGERTTCLLCGAVVAFRSDTLWLGDEHDAECPGEWSYSRGLVLVCQEAGCGVVYKYPDELAEPGRHEPECLDCGGAALVREGYQVTAKRPTLHLFGRMDTAKGEAVLSAPDDGTPTATHRIEPFCAHCLQPEAECMGLCQETDDRGHGTPSASSSEPSRSTDVPAQLAELVAYLDTERASLPAMLRQAMTGAGWPELDGPPVDVTDPKIRRVLVLAVVSHPTWWTSAPGVHLGHVTEILSISDEQAAGDLAELARRDLVAGLELWNANGGEPAGVCGICREPFGLGAATRWAGLDGSPRCAACMSPDPAAEPVDLHPDRVPLEQGERMSRLAETFPVLRRLSGVRPWDAATFAAHVNGPSSPATRDAVRFVLGVWNPQQPAARGFQALDALGRWDQHQRAAFVAWARSPWWSP